MRYPVLKMPTQTPLKPIWTPTFCQVSGHVLKSDGTYLKSYCIDAFSRTYAHSTQRCLDRGMRLYQMDSPEAETEIFNAANAKWTNNNWANELHIAADRDSRPQKLTNMNPFGPVSQWWFKIYNLLDELSSVFITVQSWCWWYGKLSFVCLRICRLWESVILNLILHANFQISFKTVIQKLGTTTTRPITTSFHLALTNLWKW